MWKPGSKVKYTSRSGRESTKTICVTSEGFASIMENGEELLFSGNGKPINAMFSPDTGGPCIQLIKEQREKKNHQKQQKQQKDVPNYKKATFEQPWDNIFAMKNLTISDLHILTSELINMGRGDEKLHLKNFGESASIDDKKKIRKIFLAAKKRTGGEDNQ